MRKVLYISLRQLPPRLVRVLLVYYIYNFLLTISKGFAVHHVLWLFPLAVRSCFPIYRIFLYFLSWICIQWWNGNLCSLGLNLRQAWEGHQNWNSLLSAKLAKGQHAECLAAADGAISAVWSSLGQVGKDCQAARFFTLRSSKMSCKHLKTMRHMFSYVFMVCSLLSSVWRGVFIGCFLFALQGRKQLGSIHLLTELTLPLVVCEKPCRLLRQGMVEDGVAYELLLRHAAAALRREAKVRTCCWHLQSFRRKWSWKDSEQVSRMW